jgi:hypothetical protein
MTTFDPEAGPWPFAVFQKGDLSFDTYPDYRTTFTYSDVVTAGARTAE